MDLGASKGGASGGPDAIRRARLVSDMETLGFDVEDRGNLEAPKREDLKPGSPRKKYEREILKVCSRLSDEVRDSIKDGRVPVTLGGDHSLAIGSIAGAASYYRQKEERIGLIWVDAHGDMNTPETSPSGNVHGMPLAATLGLGDKTLTHLNGFAPKVLPRNSCLVGIRDIDPAEREAIRDSGVHVFTMKEVDIRGMAKVITQALDFASDGTAGVHLSFDIDAVDPAIAMGTGTPSRGGLTYREAHLLMELIADSGRLTSMDLVEVNPLEDVHNNTAELSAELIQSALGKRIV
jgi:arginase